LELGQDQPLYGLQPFSLVDRLSTVETLAASYIEQLQKWGERRPFCLLGYSFGGLVAVEMARQLRKNGVEPPIVVLIDTTYLAGWKALEPWKERIRRYRYHVNEIAHGAGGLGHLVDRLRSSSVRALHKVSTTMGVELPKIASDIRGRQLLAGENYRAKPCPGRVYLFKAETRPDFFGGDPSLGWGEILSDLWIEEVPGDHGTISTGMNLKIVARKLAAFLEHPPSSQSVGRAAAAAQCPAVGGENSLPVA
jgi:aspartate racemase